MTELTFDSEWKLHKPLKKVNLRKIWKQLGPGLITGSSDDDPSGIATYSQAGAQFGFQTLWTAFFTWPLMTAIQHMCAKIGLVTKNGLTSNIKKNYPLPILVGILLLTIPAILLNIGANLSGMSGVIHLIFPKISPLAVSPLVAILIWMMMIRFPYRKMVIVFKYLSLVLLVYLAVPFFIKLNISEIIKSTFWPEIKLNKNYLGILIAILGTTISPYLFFWQVDMDAEESSAINLKEKEIKTLFINEKKDTVIGMGFSNLVMYFIILTTGAVLFGPGNTQIHNLEDAASALRPVAGDGAYLLFAIGIIGTGILSIPILAGTIAYMVCETFNWKAGMNNKFAQAKLFYWIMGGSLFIGLLFQMLKINPIQSLKYAAIGYGLTAPFAIAIIIHISNNKSIMGIHRNSLIVNILGLISLALMTICGLLYFIV
jgi:NRAMP (natural resistance-associated macrophage protein)-like metal ion transporter